MIDSGSLDGEPKNGAWPDGSSWSVPHPGSPNHGRGRGDSGRCERPNAPAAWPVGLERPTDGKADGPNRAEAHDRHNRPHVGEAQAPSEFVGIAANAVAGITAEPVAEEV